MNAHNTYSPQQMEQKITLLKEITTSQENSLFCTSKFIKNIIRKLPNNKAPGLDKITLLKLKNLPNKPVTQLYYIYEACIKLDYFPTAWKIAKIIPIPKLGKPLTRINSYSLVSLLNIFGKIFEKIINHHFFSHFDKFHIIIPQQFGFRTHHSCIHQLQRVTEYVIIERNKNRITQLLSLDLQKAFDAV